MIASRIPVLPIHKGTAPNCRLKRRGAFVNECRKNIMIYLEVTVLLAEYWYEAPYYADGGWVAGPTIGRLLGM